VANSNVINSKVVDSKDDNLIDARNMRCPMPLLKLKQALNQLVSGDVVKLIATDPTSKRDILAFAQMADHEISLTEDENGIMFKVTKG